MNIKDALSILGLSAVADQSGIKAAYRKACAKYHPDRNPAGLEMMKAVNVAYQFLVEISYNGTERPIDEEVNSNFGDMLNDAINAVIGLAGVSIEICGAWVWLTGNTKQYKAEIKASGYWWAKKKSAWYFRPPDYKSKNKGDWDLEKIRDKYGSVSVHNIPKTALAH
ncbi:MAG: DnaJ domain-containing protein [Methyloprofundus sp.]|nr:DnaJ domain-containing protein [Methyloprofundus sp.]